MPSDSPPPPLPPSPEQPSLEATHNDGAEVKHAGIFDLRTSDKNATKILDVDTENETVQDDRREERFLWVCACVILFDCAVMLNAENIIAPLGIILLEVMALIVLAKRMGIEEIQELVYGLIDRVRKVRDDV